MTTAIIGNMDPQSYTIYESSLRGNLSNHTVRLSGLHADMRYMVGFKAEGSNGNRGQMSANGNLIFDSHTSGSGVRRKFAGWGFTSADAQGQITFQGTGSAGVSGAYYFFAARCLQ